MEQPPASRPPTDLRRQRTGAERHLALAVVIFLVGVGGAAIALIYGRSAAILGITCLAAGAIIFGLLWAVLILIERFAGR